MTDQRYVSDQLTHFVGRGKPFAEQYELFIRILKEGALVAPSLIGTDKHSQYLSIADGERFSDNIRYQPGVVCFCDIPMHDLALHVRKYSQFGIAFNKRMLIAQGANPVFYVARQSATDTPSARGGSLQRSELFDVGERVVFGLFWALRSDGAFGKPPQYSAMRNLYSPNEWLIADSFLLDELFSFFKFFDTTLTDDDPDNYYMEREWRVRGRVSFDLPDVSTLFMPRDTVGRFREDIPDYLGQIMFTA